MLFICTKKLFVLCLQAAYFWVFDKSVGQWKEFMSQAFTEATKSRRGGRANRRALRTDNIEQMLPQLKRGLPYMEPLSEAQIALIDDASMAILEDVGVVFRDDIALNDWRQAGARVEGDLVKFDREMIRELISSIPAEFDYHARNAANNLQFGGPHSMFVPMTGAPFL
ncbi:MAG: trimethylamine methyltransferase family protein, partial [Gammaproteobacteria bacterium]|nr:trimethylamine methyltransferase family protein [Gammaproteobacteria bacterium]